MPNAMFKTVRNFLLNFSRYANTGGGLFFFSGLIKGGLLERGVITKTDFQTGAGVGGGGVREEGISNLKTPFSSQKSFCTNV